MRKILTAVVTILIGVSVGSQFNHVGATYDECQSRPLNTELCPTDDTLPTDDTVLVDDTIPNDTTPATTVVVTTVPVTTVVVTTIAVPTTIGVISGPATAPVTAPSTVPVAVGPFTVAALPNTGTGETTIAMVYIAIGLLGIGAVAMSASRRGRRRS